MADEGNNPNVLVRRELERKLREQYLSRQKKATTSVDALEAKAPEASPVKVADPKGGRVVTPEPIKRDFDHRMLMRLQAGRPIVHNTAAEVAGPEAPRGKKYYIPELESGTPEQVANSQDEEVVEPVSQGDSDTVIEPGRHHARRRVERASRAPDVSRRATEGEVLQTMLPEPAEYSYNGAQFRHGEQELERAAYRSPRDRLVAATAPVVTDPMAFHDTNNDGIGTTDRQIIDDRGNPIAQSVFKQLLSKFIGRI